MTRTLVVVPTYNERLTLPEVVQRLLATPGDADILVVDDGSPDGTGRLADELAAASERVHVMHRPSKSGLGPAYRAGLGWGLDEGYDILVEMDADLSHDPSHLPALVAATESADLVIGSRYIPGGGTENWPRRRRALSSGGNQYVRWVTGLPVRDATSGYRAFRRDVLIDIGLRELESDGYSFQLETVLTAWREGFTVAEVPIIFVERRAGASKISRGIVVEALWRVLLWGLRGPRRPAPPHVHSVVARSSAPADEDGRGGASAASGAG